ncbi:MAG: hypothetical protein ACREBU_16740 [Nitrososphaera sp.]
MDDSNVTFTLFLALLTIDISAEAKKLVARKYNPENLYGSLIASPSGRFRKASL